MNCNEFKDLIVVSIYGKMTAPEKDAFDAHLDKCSGCAELYRTTKQYDGIFEDEKEVPLPDWDKSWRTISDGVFRKKRFTFSFFPNLRMAAAAAGIVAIFTVGLLAGRQFFQRPSPELAQANILPIEYYAENLEPLLINFTNRSDEQMAEDYSDVELRILTDMLAQTRLLKYLAEQRGAQSQTRLLEDLEFVLVDITNLRPGDTGSAQLLKRLIKEKELKYRLRQLADEQPFI